MCVYGLSEDPEEPNKCQRSETLEATKLTNVYLKEQTEYIQYQINKIRDSIEDWPSRIAW